MQIMSAFRSFSDMREAMFLVYVSKVGPSTVAMIWYSTQLGGMEFTFAMVCCADDMTFLAVACIGYDVSEIPERAWVERIVHDLHIPQAVVFVRDPDHRLVQIKGGHGAVHIVLALAILLLQVDVRAAVEEAQIPLPEGSTIRIP